MIDLRKELKNGTGVRFRTLFEMKEMLQMCDEQDIRWIGEQRATEFVPAGGENDYIRISDEIGGLCHGSVNRGPSTYCLRLVEWSFLLHGLHTPVFHY